MKRFMFLSIGVLCLAIAVLIGFYVGSQQAKAQAPSMKIIGYSVLFDNVAPRQGYHHMVILANGDMYDRYGWSATQHGVPTYTGNYWKD